VSGERRDDEVHWLMRRSTRAWLWRIGAGVLALTLLAQVFVHLHAWFGIDGWFGFHAVYGFLSCVAMVLLAKLLGVLLKRPDTYYDDDDA
jgi:hypothetical protein